MASLDVNRPAAQEQLAVLGTQVDAATLPIVEGQQPVDIARRAMQAAQAAEFRRTDARYGGPPACRRSADGRDEGGASDLRPTEVLLVVDALTGQDAVNVAKNFSDEVPLTGVVLTRMDGDARGGAALSMRAVTGKPIKFAGTGEKAGCAGGIPPERVADRILGMGDVVSLVEKAAATIKEEDAESLAKRMAKGQFDLNDLRMQLQQMQKMGGLGALAGMMPGMKKAKAAMADSGDGRQGPRSYGRDHRLDDAERTRQSRTAECQAQEARGSGQRAGQCRT